MNQLDSNPPMPPMPRDLEGPIFSAPWQAQAFAMAMALRDRGLFTWEEWAQALGAEIKRAQAAGDPDNGDTYYGHWLNTLEQLIIEKGALGGKELTERRDAWDRAARATPHGKPIVLGAELSDHHHD